MIPGGRSSPSSCFNPRSRAGSDVRLRQDRLHRIVSIHAPARGATSSRRPRRHGSCCFNPRSRAGSDMIPGGRSSPSSCFNPRSRAGSDGLSSTPRNACGIVSTCANPHSSGRPAHTRAGDFPGSPTFTGGSGPANLPRFSCQLEVRVRRQGVPPGPASAWRPRAPRAASSWRQGSRTAGCPSPGPSC
jgi:hypothetical protein